MSMSHLLILAVHLLATISKIMRPGGVRAVVAESVLLKYQLVISSVSESKKLARAPYYRVGGDIDIDGNTMST